MFPRTPSQVALLVGIGFGHAAFAAVVEISPGADVRAAIAALRPGDELVLQGGTYSFNSRFAVTAVGTANQPITIRGKTGESAIIQMSTTSQNVMDVDGSQHMIIKNLRITGGSHGVHACPQVSGSSLGTHWPLHSW